jgi:hypothetical protein
LQAEFQLVKADAGVDTSKVTVQLTCETGDVTCNVAWSNKTATCSFIPTCTGDHKVRLLICTKLISSHIRKKSVQRYLNYGIDDDDDDDDDFNDDYDDGDDYENDDYDENDDFNDDDVANTTMTVSMMIMMTMIMIMTDNFMPIIIMVLMIIIEDNIMLMVVMIEIMMNMVILVILVVIMMI